MLFPCNRIGVAILGLEVPHAHIHLVPMDKMDDINFKNPKLRFSPEEFKEIASKISSKIILITKSSDTRVKLFGA